MTAKQFKIMAVPAGQRITSQVVYTSNDRTALMGTRLSAGDVVCVFGDTFKETFEVQKYVVVARVNKIPLKEPA